jgi:subfamily B ATP-binding cassette protein MsbA
VPGTGPRSRQRSLVGEALRPYYRWLAIILFAMIVESAMVLAAPWPLKLVIDHGVGPHPAPAWLLHWRELTQVEGTLGIALVAAILTVAIAIIDAVAGYVANYYTTSVGQWVGNDLRLRVYAHLQRLSLAYYDTHQTGVLLSTITDDVDTIQSFASEATLGILIDVLTIAGMLGLMLWLEWDFALIAVAVTPFLLLFVMRFKRAVKDATHEVRKRQSDIEAVLQQGLESVRVVKAYGRQQLEQTRLAEAGAATVAAALKARRIKSLFGPVVAVTVAGCTAYILYRGAALIVADQMTIGTLTVFLAYLTKFFKPVKDLATMSNTIAQAAVGVDRVRAILDTDDVIPERANAVVPKQLRGAIAFEHVAFAYDADTPVLRDVTFAIQPGQRIGIVGATGGGKSTIVSMIPRFYDPTAGRVLVDGVDVRDYKLAGLRGQIGYVLQDTVLFRGTVRENIAYGRPGATDAEIVAAAKLANADEFIMKMHRGYDAMVGERGLTLSGGQRQRIGIARAVVRDTPILILDEPTAALDTESERVVMEALERLMKGRTVITIAHRLSTIRDADDIVVLNEGVVAEQGTHDQLLARGALYAELYRVQIAPADAGSIGKVT